MEEHDHEQILIIDIREKFPHAMVGGRKQHHCEIYQSILEGVDD
jgi:hypothetical protein